MRKGSWASQMVLKLKPWSPAAFVVALAILGIAVCLRVLLDSLGATVEFATFFPAVLLASLLVGAPAGTCAALLAIPIVWWAFLPPVFEFSQLDHDDIDRFQLFLLAVSVLIWFSHLCRIIVRMRDQRPA